MAYILPPCTTSNTWIIQKPVPTYARLLVQECGRVESVPVLSVCIIGHTTVVSRFTVYEGKERKEEEGSMRRHLMCLYLETSSKKFETGIISH